MADKTIESINHNYEPVNKYIDDQARLKRSVSSWRYAKSTALILVAVGILAVLLAYAYSIYKKNYKITNSTKENKLEKVVQGKNIKYNSTTHLFETTKLDGGYQVITRRKYSKTEDLLQKTNNYKETCYISYYNMSYEYQYSSKETNFLNQKEMASMMKLSRDKINEFEQYCNYTK